MKKLTLLILLFIVSASLMAQPRDKKERVKALKVAYITERLNLTKSEAEKFWPIYNTFDEKQFEIRHKKMRKLLYKLEHEEVENLSEKEAQHLINEIQNQEEELYLLRKHFITEVQKVLPANKVILLRKTEEEFNRKLLREFRDRRD